MKRLTHAVAAVALVAVGGLASSVPASSAENPDASKLTQLSGAEKALLTSGDAIVVEVDSVTGDVVEVSEQPDAGISPAAVTTVCNSTDACWNPVSTPYASYRFTGTGASGTWANRGTFRVRSKAARLTWVYGGKTVTGPRLPAGSLGTFTGYPVTGKKVVLG